MIFINDRAMSVGDLTGKFVKLFSPTGFFVRYIFPLAKFQSSKTRFAIISCADSEKGTMVEDNFFLLEIIGTRNGNPCVSFMFYA